MSDFTYDGDLGAVADQIRAAVADGVRKGTETIAADAKRRVPVLFGDLRDSESVTVDGTVGHIAFRDKIAVIVHEDQTARHDDGQAKFLENAMNERKAQALDEVAARLRSLFS